MSRAWVCACKKFALANALDEVAEPMLYDEGESVHRHEACLLSHGPRDPETLVLNATLKDAVAEADDAEAAECRVVNALPPWIEPSIESVIEAVRKCRESFTNDEECSR